MEKNDKKLVKWIRDRYPYARPEDWDMGTWAEISDDYHEDFPTSSVDAYRLWRVWSDYEAEKYEDELKARLAKEEKLKNKKSHFKEGLDELCLDKDHWWVPQEKWKDGHPMVVCNSDMGHGEGEYLLSWDDLRELWWCTSCCTTFTGPYTGMHQPLWERAYGPGYFTGNKMSERPKIIWRTQSSAGARKVCIPVRDRVSGKIVMFPIGE